MHRARAIVMATLVLKAASSGMLEVFLIEDGRIALDERIPMPRLRQRSDPLFDVIEKRILDRVLQQPAEEAPSREPARNARTWPALGGLMNKYAFCATETSISSYLFNSIAVFLTVPRELGDHDALGRSV